MFKSICSSIDKLDKAPWEEVESELLNQKGLTKDQTSKLKEFVIRKDTPRAMLNKLIEDKVFGDHASANETLKEMDLLFSYCEAMGCDSNLLFDFSLARGLDYYTGLIYEAIMLEGT